MEGGVIVPGNGSSDAAAGKGLPYFSLLVVVLGAFMAILDSSIINVALPKLMAVFSVGTDRIEWVSTGYLLSSGVVVPVSGYLADRIGSKYMYIYALGVFTVGSALCGMAWSCNSLVGFRVLQAIGGGMIMPLSMTILYALVPREKIGMALGMWGIAAATAPAIGPTLGGYLVDKFDWRLIFTINIPVGIVTVLLILFALPDFPKKGKLRFDIMGFVLSALGCFALLLALSQGEDKGWTSLYIVTLLAVGTFSLILFILWELRFPEPMLDVRLLKNVVFSVSLLATAMLTMGLFSVIFLVPIFVQNLLGYTPFQTGLLVLPMALTMGILMPVSGRLFDRVGALWPGLVGLAVAVIVTYRLHNIGLNSSYHGIQVTLVFWAMGLGLAMMPISTAGIYTIPNALVGRAAALNSLIRQIASSMGIAFMTYMMMKRQIYHYNWLSSTVTYVSPTATAILGKLSALFGKSGALELLSLNTTRLAMASAIDDDFLIGALISVLTIPLILFLSKGRVEATRLREQEKLNQTPGNSPE